MSRTSLFVARRLVLLAAVALSAMLQCADAAPAAAPGTDAVPAAAEGAPAEAGPRTATDEPASLPSTKPSKVLSKDPPGMTRLMPDADAWIDPKNKRVVLDGVVCLRAGTLEMFACLKGTKEHESILAVDTKAYPVHAALLAVGAKPGAPVQFQPKYRAASGTPIDVTLIWKDEKGAEHHARAQDWVRNLRTRKAMDYSWVFAGSGFFEDEEGHKHYQAEGGDFICVSNFPSAMLDLPVESSQGTAELLFEAFTENIPPKGTKVRVVLTPRLEK
jgi:hypothetical protein